MRAMWLSLMEFVMYLIYVRLLAMYFVAVARLMVHLLSLLDRFLQKN